MKNATKMLLTSKLREGEHHREDEWEHRRENYPKHPYPMYDNQMVDRHRDKRGREHYDNGRYSPMRSEGDRTVSVNYEPHYPYVPPIYQAGHSIGFEREEKMGNVVPFENGHEKIDREMAEEWAARMENEDGTIGPHWTFDQTKQAMAQRGYDCDPVEFFLAMNMMYSDYCKLAKKMNINTVDFYSSMAKAFLDDKDGGDGKLMRYFRYVVK